MEILALRAAGQQVVAAGAVKPHPARRSFCRLLRLDVGRSRLHHHPLRRKAEIQRPDLRLGQRLAVRGHDGQHLAAEAQDRPVLGHGDLKLRGITEPRQQGQVDAVAAAVEVEDGVRRIVGHHHEDIRPRASGQHLAARAVDKDIVARTARQAGHALGRQQKIGQPGSRHGAAAARLRNPQPGQIDLQHRQPGLRPRNRQDLQAVAQMHHAQRGDIAQPRRGGIGQRLQMQQPPARQQHHQRQPVVRPRGQYEGPALHRDHVDAADRLEARVQRVLHMLGHRQQAILIHPHHRDRGIARGRRQQIGLAARLHRAQSLHPRHRDQLADPQAVGRGQRPVLADQEHRDPALAARSRCQIGLPADGERGQRRNPRGIDPLGVGQFRQEHRLRPPVRPEDADPLPRRPCGVKIGDRPDIHRQQFDRHLRHDTGAVQEGRDRPPLLRPGQRGRHRHRRKAARNPAAGQRDPPVAMTGEPRLHRHPVLAQRQRDILARDIVDQRDDRPRSPCRHHEFGMFDPGAEPGPGQQSNQSKHSHDPTPTGLTCTSWHGQSEGRQTMGWQDYDFCEDYATKAMEYPRRRPQAGVRARGPPSARIRRRGPPPPAPRPRCSD